MLIEEPVVLDASFRSVAMRDAARACLFISSNAARRSRSVANACASGSRTSPMADSKASTHSHR